MTDYVKSTNFTAKDSLTTGDPNKLVKGSEFDTEFDAIASASATKLDKTTYTAADVLAKLLTVDGAGSGVDADTLDGYEGSEFALLAGSPVFQGNVATYNGNMTIRATASSNANYWLRDDAGNSRGVLYWDRASDSVRLNAYTGGVSSPTKYLYMSDTTANIDGNEIWTDIGGNGPAAASGYTKFSSGTYYYTFGTAPTNTLPYGTVASYAAPTGAKEAICAISAYANAANSLGGRRSKVLIYSDKGTQILSYLVSARAEEDPAQPLGTVLAASQVVVSLPVQSDGKVYVQFYARDAGGQGSAQLQIIGYKV